MPFLASERQSSAARSLLALRTAQTGLCRPNSSSQKRCRCSALYVLESRRCNRTSGLPAARQACPKRFGACRGMVRPACHGKVGSEWRARQASIETRYCFRHVGRLQLSCASDQNVDTRRHERASAGGRERVVVSTRAPWCGIMVGLQVASCLPGCAILIAVTLDGVSWETPEL